MKHSIFTQFATKTLFTITDGGEKIKFTVADVLGSVILFIAIIGLFAFAGTIDYNSIY